MFHATMLKASTAAAVLTVSASGITITNFDSNPQRYLRWVETSPTTLVPTTSEAFWQGHHDFSAVGWVGSLTHGTWRARDAVTAISPRHIIFAQHDPVRVNTGVQFMSPTGEIINRRAVASQQIVTPSGVAVDIGVATLDQPLPDWVEPVKVGVLGGADYINQELVVYGQVGRLGSNRLSQFWTPSLTFAPWRFLSNGGAPAGTAISRLHDSGSPTFIEQNGELVLVGIRWTPTADTWVPAAAESIAALLERDGERMRRNTDPLTPARVEPCVADLTGDGRLDGNDITTFISAFIAGQAAADLADTYNSWDGNDITTYVTSFLGGCPQ